METSTSDPVAVALLRDGIVTQEQVERAQRDHDRSGRPVHELLLRFGYCSEADVRTATAKSLGMSVVNLAGVAPNADALKLVPADLAYRHQLVPIELNNSTLTVAVADPLDVAGIDDVRLATGLDVRPVCADAEEIRRLVEDAYVDEVVSDEENDVEVLGEGEVDVEDLQRMAREALVIRLVNYILRQGVLDRASDVHIEPFEDEMKVRYRIDGILHEVPAPAKRLLPAIVSRIKILSDLDIAERRMPQDGRMKLLVSGHQIEVRVSIVPTLHGESVAMRLLDQSSIQLSLQELGFAERDLDRYHEVIRQSYGMLLVTGPTGSGKTTTLYASLRELYSPEKKIITIENPVEYQLHGVNQIHVRENIGLTFARGLRHIVRQDPDIIMVGEVRDKETADIAIHAALTGHLILSTLHTNDAAGSFSRLLDMGVEPFLAASSIIAVMAQRLVRRICPDCRETYQPSSRTVEVMAKETDGQVPERFYRGAGCSTCRFTGYVDRSGIFELLIVNDEIRRLIMEHGSASQIKAAAIREGMITLRQDGWEKVRDGMTTIDEVLRVTSGDEAMF